MRLLVIRNKTDFYSMQAKWDLLYRQASDATVFQSYAYNKIAWEYVEKRDPAAELYIVAVESQNQLICLLPCYMDRKGRLRFINDLHTDFCDCLIEKNCHDIHHLMEDIFEEIQKESRIKLIYFDNLRGSSPLIPYFKVFGKNTMIFSQTEHTFLTLKRNVPYPESFLHLRSKERAKLKKILRDTPETSLRHFRKAEQAFPGEELHDLWRNIIQAGIRSEDYLNNNFFQFTRDLYQSGLLEIILLYESEKPVAAAYYYASEKQDFYIQWIILCSDKRLNLPLDLLSCTEFSRTGDAVFDFGRGAYFYKVHNFKPEIKPLYRLLLSKTVSGNLYILYRVFIAHLRKTYLKYHE